MRHPSDIIQDLLTFFRSSLSKASFIPSALDSTMRATIKGFAYLVGLFAVFAAGDSLLGKHIVIEPMSVPRSLEADGYTGAVVARMLLEEVQVVRRTGDAHRTVVGSDNPTERIAFQSEEDLKALESIQIPSSPLSLRAMAVMFRDFIGQPEQKIGGAITVRKPDEKPAVYVVTLFGAAASAKPQEHADLRTALRLSAHSIARAFDPVGVASYYLDKGKLEEAKQLADDLIWKRRKEGLVLRGLYETKVCEYKSCRPEEAAEKIKDGIEYFEKAISRHADFGEAYNAWGAALVQLGDENYAEALKKYNEALRINPDNVSALRNRALVHRRNGRYAEAIADYDRAIKLKLEDIDVFFDLGRSYEAVNNSELAIDAYGGAIQLDRRSAYALNNRCWMRASRGERAAIADCDEAMALIPDRYTFYDSRGFAYLNLKAFDRAIADYDKALDLYEKLAQRERLDPGDAAWSLFGRGVAKLRKGEDIDSAKADMVAATKLDGAIASKMAKLGVKPEPGSRLTW